MKKITKLKIIFYTLLILNIAMFFYSFLVNNWFLTAVCFVMALFLSRMSDRIPLPKFFQDMKDQRAAKIKEEKVKKEQE